MMKWHDFREERPTKEDDYLIKVKLVVAENTYYFYFVDKWNNRFQSWLETSSKKVVAWARLPRCDIK